MAVEPDDIVKNRIHVKNVGYENLSVKGGLGFLKKNDLLNIIHLVDQLFTIMYARPFIHSSNQILLLTDPIDSEFLYQLWGKFVSLCCYIWNALDHPSVIICVIGVIIYNIILIRIINHIKAIDEEIALIKTNINHITNLFVELDDYLEEYINATNKELKNIKIEKNE